jgi:PAS domain S-box-containing protein
MPNPARKYKANLPVALLIPLLAAGIQWWFWSVLQPLTWILLYPAVFFSARFGGLNGGLLATGLAAALGDYWFIAPQYSFAIANFNAQLSIAIFLLMGGLFSLFFARLQSTNAELLILQTQKLEQNQRRLQQTLDAVNAGIWEWDLQTHTNQWSDNLWSLYGLQRHSFPASYETWLSTVRVTERDAVEASVQHAVANRQAINLEWRLAQAIDGKERWLMACGQPEFNAAGEITLYRGIVQDITERKQREEHIHFTEMRYKALADQAAPDGLFVHDHNGDFVEVNKQACLSVGYTKEELLHMNVLDLEQDFDLLSAQAAWDKMQPEQFAMLYGHHKRKDGVQFPVEVHFGLLIFAEQRLYIAQVRDISERVAAEQRTAEMTAAKIHAEAGNAAKSTFLSNMSHEIRTPMNAVLGLCYLLEQRPLDEDSHQLVKKINHSGHSLLAIINDILDFSKIEAGRLEIENAPFRLRDILEQLADLMAAAAMHKDMELSIIPPLDADALIGDGPRLKQVLINLLSNAIKFTENGEVELRIRLESEQNGRLQLRFAVRDTGIGIAEEQLHDLFSAFTQADSSINRRFGGTGLGLTISRQLVQLMGGELQVNSSVGLGSEFWFVLPLQRDNVPDIAPAVMRHLNVLVVDDHKSAREALLLTAEHLGWQAQAVDSGQAAILQLIDHDHPESNYDILLIDWKMPGLDGLATTQLIRKLLPDTGHTPIILMITAYSLQELQTKPDVQLVDGLLNKPVTPSTLYNAVSRALAQRIESGMDAEVLQSNNPRIAGVRVLVVDDSDINREVAQRILEADGAQVYLAEDGQEALDWLSTPAHAVDIVLMDIQMPRLDGYAATRQIRRLPHCAALPILALTAGAFKSLQEQALDAGMNDFISKPFDVAQMMAMIQRWTANKPSLQPLPTLTAEHDQLSSSKALLSALKPNHASQSRVNIWSDQALYQSYLARFIENYRQVGHELLQLDAVAAKALAHKLKGAAGTLGLHSIVGCCIEVETAIADAADWQTPANHLQLAIDAAATDLDAQTPAGKPENIPNTDYTLKYKHTELITLFEKLGLALSFNNPGQAEPILNALANSLGSEPLAAIKEKILAFDFRNAEQLTHALLAKIQASSSE